MESVLQYYYYILLPSACFGKGHHQGELNIVRGKIKHLHASSLEGALTSYICSYCVKLSLTTNPKRWNV